MEQLVLGQMGPTLPFGPSLMVGSLGGSGESLGVRKLGAEESVTEGPRLLSFIPAPRGRV